MTVTKTKISGLVLLSFDRARDDRGWFQRVYCARSFREHGLSAEWPQSSVCFNERAGTLRGLHWQAAPHAETKLVTVLRGRVFDVVVDLRPDSSTFQRFESFLLDGEKPASLFIPEYCAHGYLTLSDHVLMDYRMTTEYIPEAARILNHCDPRLAIPWPRTVECISERDNHAPHLADLRVP
jgi:dTDP-4-dehydrorhamnose 3,5-epimerase